MSWQAPCVRRCMEMSRYIPIAVTTGSLYPLSTLDSIKRLKELGIQDVELTLQSNEFFVTFNRELSMPILPDLVQLVQSGKLCVRSVHAPMTRSYHCYNLWSRMKHLEYAIEVCQLLGGQVVVVHPEHLFRTYEDAIEYLSSDGVSLHTSLLPGIKHILDLVQSKKMILALENIQDWYDEIYFNSPLNMLRFMSEIDHPALRFTFDLMHSQVSATLRDFTDFLANFVVNVHASDLLYPIKRVAIGKGITDWDSLLPKLQAFPNLRQITVELSDPESADILDSVKFLSTSLLSAIL